MILLVLLLFITLLLGLHIILSKDNDYSMGSGLGQINNEIYGMNSVADEEKHNRLE